MPTPQSDDECRPPADRRTMVLDHARSLFLDRGYSVISMQQIADAVGINKATLYHHFRDKDDLFTAVLGRELDTVQRRLESMVAEGGTTREILERIARDTIAMTAGDMPSLFMSLKNEVSAERRAAFFAGRELPWRGLRPIFAAAIERGEFRPANPDVLVELFFAMTRSQAPGPWRSTPAQLTDDAVQSIVSLFLDGAMSDQEKIGVEMSDRMAHSGK